MKQNKVTTMMSGDFAFATGIIEYGFTNDYMFRILLQKNKKVLKALIFVEAMTISAVATNILSLVRLSISVFLISHRSRNHPNFMPPTSF